MTNLRSAAFRRLPRVAVASLLLASVVISSNATAGVRARAAGSGASPAKTGDTLPNILLLVSDDQAYSTWGSTLMPDVFSEMVDKGVTFSRAYDESSLCCPSRAQIMTGLFEHHTRVDRNGVLLNRPTIIQALHDIGYRTSLTGKYLNSAPCDPRPEFDQWVCSSAPPSNYDYVDPYMNVNGTWTQFTGYTTDILAGYAASFITNTPADQPFFVMYTPTSPHLPANDPRCATLPVTPNRPPSWDEDTQTDAKPAYMHRLPMSKSVAAAADYQHQAMTQATECLDGSMDTVLQALTASGREDNTLVIYLSDNGYLYGEHRRSGKDVPYEEAVHVPFVIRYPALVPETNPFTSDALVENVDIVPTIADVVGIHWGADGTSLIPILNGTETSVRNTALIEGCEGSTYPCEPDTIAYGESDAPSYSGVVTAQYKYVEYVTGEKELYDLVADPYEITNLDGNPSYAQVEADRAADLASLVAPSPTDTTIVSGPSGSVDSRIETFTYFSQSSRATFQCRLDVNGVTGTWASCPGGSIIEGPLLVDGSYTFEVQATDENGVVDPTPDTRSFSLATTGPDVTITLAPQAHTKKRTNTFRFGSHTPGVTFQCQDTLLGTTGTWTPCTTGTRYSSQADGVYLFQVEAVDSLGVGSDPPAQWVYNIDHAGPIMTFVDAPSLASNVPTPTFSFQANEVTSGPITCAVDVGASSDCSTGVDTLSTLPDGNHTFKVTAKDTLGNTKVSKFVWIVDTTPPVMGLTGTPPNGGYLNSSAATFTATANEQLDSVKGLTCMQEGLELRAKICALNTAMTFTGLTDGAHSFGIDGLDGAGNASAPIVWIWTVDTVKPAVTINTGPFNPSASKDATFTFSAVDASPVTFTCSLDGASYQSCVSGVTYTGLATGAHTFSLVGTDAAGNAAAPVTWTWTITGFRPQ